jgi:hypothetical protein
MNNEQDLKKIASFLIEIVDDKYINTLIRFYKIEEKIAFIIDEEFSK